MAEGPSATAASMAAPALDASATASFGLPQTIIVGAAVGVTSMSFNVWWPFLPLYVLKLGATSDANALFWVAVATTAQGIARLTSGPVWGVLSDRWGRKVMLLRSLYLSALIGAAAGVATAPWQLVVSLVFAGLFSGFGPAAIALASVSVPEARLNRSLSIITGAQYMGMTAGPAVGAVLALFVGYRGAILFSAVVPLITGTAVLLFVPADRVSRRGTGSDGGEKSEIEPFRASFQFWLAIALYFIIFAFNQLIRLATPIVLRTLEGHKDVAGISGLAFSLAGLVSAVSVLFLAPMLFKAGHYRRAFAVSCAVAALGLAGLALAGVAVTYIAGFLTIAAVLSGMTPATNTLIAANVTRSRRGTAFGVAGSAQALASIAGPGAAAIFAAVSFDLGFALLAALMIAFGALLYVALREPRLE